jgi:hypothetical protein
VSSLFCLSPCQSARGIAKCSPLVLGPEFAIARIPAPTNRRLGSISSSLWQPQVNGRFSARGRKVTPTISVRRYSFHLYLSQ